MKMAVGIAHNIPIAAGQPNWESSADVLVQVEAIEDGLVVHTDVQVLDTQHVLISLIDAGLNPRRPPD